jgi:Uma2 family endonuclease
MERAGAWCVSTEFGRIPTLRERIRGAQNRVTCLSDELMNATVAKPETGHRLSRAELRRRWDELADDPLVAAIPYKVELNEKGVIEVSPPTTQHASLQFSVAYELRRQRPEGTTFTECPVETEIGMRIPDVVWASSEFIQAHGGEAQFRAAPDLCVEVLSPRNTRAEMAEKIAAYLAAGAREVWLVGENGAPEIYTNAGRVATSTLGFELRVAGEIS